MSSALVRQALELVDPEDCLVKKRGKSARRPGQGRQSFKSKTKGSAAPSKSKEQLTQENIKKLLALSKPTADSAVAEKIVERAIKQKPLADKPQLKVDDNKSILFPEAESFEDEAESFEDFEQQLFCS